MWKGKPSEMTYEMIEYKENDHVFLRAENGMISATDLLIFKPIGEGT